MWYGVRVRTKNSPFDQTEVYLVCLLGLEVKLLACGWYIMIGS